MTAIWADIAWSGAQGIVDFAEELAQEDAQIRERLKHPAPVMLGPVTDAIHEMYRKIFESEGAYAGDVWAPLEASTIEKKHRYGYPDWTLVATGDLMASLTEDAKGGYAEMREGDTLAIGTDDDTYKFHQHGTSRMPQRQITPDEPPGQDVNQWADLITDYVIDGRL